MPTYQTSNLLTTLSQQNNSFLKTIEQWADLPEVSLQTPPAAGSWSALQCIEHLNSYGRYFLPALESALNRNHTGRIQEIFVSGWLGNYFTNIMKPQSNGKVKKMNAPKAHSPATELQVSKVLGEFKQQCLTMNNLIIQAATTSLNKAKVPISIFPLIKLKAGDVFMFVLAHNERHIRQAERAIETYRSEEGIPKRSRRAVLN